MSGGIKQNILDQFLQSDQARFKYLFPYRETVPIITNHIFTNVIKSKMPIDAMIIDNMFNLDYLGWTVKVLLGIDLFPIQIAILQMLWNTSFPMLVASRGGSKSFLLAVYSILRGLLDQGTKITIVGGGLRQAKIVFGYVDAIWDSAPILRDIVGGGKNAGPRQNVDLCYFKIGRSIIYALPLGDGSRIRGFRANVAIADEFDSISPDIFDIVVRGFTATSKTPVEEAKRVALEKELQKIGVPSDVKNLICAKSSYNRDNQIIYSGTASYAFKHFAQRYKMWEAIVKSKGDVDVVSQIFGGINNIPEDFNYRDYAVIRVPCTHLPDGLLDKKQIAHAKATLPKNIFLMEYGGIFVSDSDGFFPRSLIETCTTGINKSISTLDGDVRFTPLMAGTKGKRYVVGIDPAAERDNLGIVIIEIWPNHSRVVYCWAVNKSEFSKRKKAGLIKDDDYYIYCCSKIREITKLFNPERIEMDSQGGGYAIAEMLRTKKLIPEGDCPIYEIVDFKNPKSTDGDISGRHILHLTQQTSDFNRDAYSCLHKAFETRGLLFPSFDSLQMFAASISEKVAKISCDTYEDNVFNIEELKNELCTIQISETSTGKEKFDTPSVIKSGFVDGKHRKGRLKKDRCTALILAYKYVSDKISKTVSTINYNEAIGDVAKNIKSINKNEVLPLFTGPGVGRLQNLDQAQTTSVCGIKRRKEC